MVNRDVVHGLSTRSEGNSPFVHTESGHQNWSDLPTDIPEDPSHLQGPCFHRGMRERHCQKPRSATIPRSGPSETEDRPIMARPCAQHDARHCLASATGRTTPLRDGLTPLEANAAPYERREAKKVDRYPLAKIPVHIPRIILAN